MDRRADSTRQAITDVTATLKRILRNAIVALDGSAGMLLLWHAGSAAPAYEVSIGLRGDARSEVINRLLSLRDELYDTPASRAQSGRLSFDRSDPDTGTLRHHLSTLPLWATELDRGLIGVLRTAREFTPAEERVLGAFADQAGITVRNASLIAQLRREQARLSRVIEQHADGIAVCDREGTILSVNAALERLTGQHRRALIGKRVDRALQLRGERGGPPGSDAFHKAREGISPSEGSPAVLKSSDGTLFHVQISATVPPDLDQPEAEVIFYFHDSSRLRELDELRSTFLSLTSHELQTPVAIIKAYAETLHRKYGGTDDTLGKGLLAIDDETDRLGRLVTNLLQVSRIEAGALPVRMVDVDLSEVAERVARRLQPRSTKHKIEVRFVHPFPTVSADPERMEEVLSNLVDNAIKYSPRGGAIVIAGAATPASVEVSVMDSGPGIPLREQPRLFQRFYRLRGGPNKQTTGVGLGLFLVKAIVEAHGGQIWVNSTWGHGSRFVFSLPRGQGLALPSATNIEKEPDRDAH